MQANQLLLKIVAPSMVYRNVVPPIVVYGKLFVLSRATPRALYVQEVDR